MPKKLKPENLAIKLAVFTGTDPKTGLKVELPPTQVLALHACNQIVFTTNLPINSRYLYKLTHLLLCTSQRTVVGKVVAAGVDYKGPGTPGIPKGYKVPSPWEHEHAKHWIAMSHVKETDSNDWVATGYNDHPTLKEVFQGRPSRLYVSPKSDIADAKGKNSQIDSATLTLTDAECAIVKVCLEDRHQRTRTPGELLMIEDILKRF